MEKRISVREWATVKRIAQSVQPMVQKKDTIQKKIKELATEYQSLNDQIEGFEHGIKALCGGLGTEALIHREVVTVPGKYDKDGRPLKKTSYEPNPCVKFDKDNAQYVITLPEDRVVSQAHINEDGGGMEEAGQPISEEPAYSVEEMNAAIAEANA